MFKQFEKDMDALEELTLRLPKDHTRLDAYGDGDFTVSVYCVAVNGSRSLWETVASDSNNIVAIDLERYKNGEIVATHLTHGDDTFTTVPVDAVLLPSDTHYLVMVPNDNVTVRFYAD